MITILIVILIAFATILQGITGFGYGLLAAPLLLILISKTASVTTLIITGIGLNIFLFLHIRDHALIDRRLFIWLLGSTAIGLPFGLLVLQSVNTHTLRIIAGVCAILFSIIFYTRVVVVARTAWTTVIAGYVAGILQTSIGIIGLPIALLLSGQKRPKNEIRKTLAAFFIVIDLITIPFFYVTGTLSTKGVVWGVISIPGAFLGAYFGSRIVQHVSQKWFTQLTLILVFVAGLIAIYSGLFN